MPIVNLFSKRQRLGNAVPSAYEYDEIPKAFRAQVVHVWNDAIGTCYGEWLEYVSVPLSTQAWTYIHDTLAREWGLLSLGQQAEPKPNLVTYFLTAETSQVLDAIDLTFQVINGWLNEQDTHARVEVGIVQSAEKATAELNTRFQEHNLGYKFDGKFLRRIDSESAEQEITEPAMVLLRSAGFEGAEEEFQRAHMHYRSGFNKEAIVAACQAVESVLRVICDGRKWTYPANSTNKQLIDVVFAQGLIPNELQGYFGALRGLLESGLATVRNRTSSHGQGKAPIAVPTHVTAYALHLAASNILFLVELYRTQ
jgi:hypothetical protein